MKIEELYVDFFTYITQLMSDPNYMDLPGVPVYDKVDPSEIRHIKFLNWPYRIVEGEYKNIYDTAQDCRNSDIHELTSKLARSSLSRFLYETAVNTKGIIMIPKVGRDAVMASKGPINIIHFPHIEYNDDCIRYNKRFDVYIEFPDLETVEYAGSIPHKNIMTSVQHVLQQRENGDYVISLTNEPEI